MNVTIKAIDQRYDLATKEITSYVVLSLPSGFLIQAKVDEQSAAIIIEQAGNNVPPNDEFGEPERHRVHMDPGVINEALAPTPVRDDPTPATRHVDSGIVEWEKLPDTQLPPVMKTILRTSGVPSHIDIKDLDQLKLQIAAQLANRPKANQLNMNTGPQRAVEAVQRRTIPQDSYGNPLPPGGIVEPDPGEGVEDEDGVEQV